MEDGFAKGMIVTAAISVLMWLGDDDTIKWLVEIDGLKAWFFLALAHFYFVINCWARYGKVLNVSAIKEAREKSPKWQRGEKSLSARVEIYLSALQVGVAGWVGATIIISNILLGIIKQFS